MKSPILKLTQMISLSIQLNLRKYKDKLNCPGVSKSHERLFLGDFINPSIIKPKSPISFLKSIKEGNYQIKYISILN
jgi:hypothetical protein